MGKESAGYMTPAKDAKTGSLKYGFLTFLVFVGPPLTKIRF